MNELDTSLDTLAFFRGWKSTFLAAVEASAQGARAADEARARAERLLGRLPDAPAVDPIPPRDRALAALEASVARLEAFEAARTRRETWIGWMARATPGGPLSEWRAEAERQRPVIDRLLAEADPEALPDVRAELDRQLAAVDAVADATRTRLHESRGQVKVAVDTFEQAVRILTEDVRRMEERLERLRAEAAAAEGDGLVPLLGFGLFAGAVFGLVGWFGGGANAATWATVAGGGALVIGLAVGLARWARALGDTRDKLAALEREARELGADLEGARATVLAELAAATAAWEEAAGHAAELRFDPGRLDTTPARAKVGDPGVTLPLDGLRSRLATVTLSRRGFQVAAGAVGVVTLVVAGTLGLVLNTALAPAESVADAAAPGEVPAAAPAGSGTGGASPLVGEPAEAAPGTATEAPADAAPKPSAPPPKIAAGAWSGTLGLATVEGTLAQDGGKLTGSFTLTEGGAPRTCTAKGTASVGDKLRLTLQGCGSPVRLEGSIKDGGRTLRGKARSTGTGAFAGAEVVDAFELKAF